MVWNVKRSLAELSYWIGFNPRRTVVRAGEGYSMIGRLNSLKLGSRPLHLADLRRIYRCAVRVWGRIDPAALGAVRAGRRAAEFMRIAAGDAPAYGINTGFGLPRQHAHPPRAAHAPATQHHPLAQRRRRTTPR